MICENFLSETRAGSNDMPLQLQFDFRFRRARKEHLKQMCRAKFCNYTNVKSHYPRVESDLRYSEPHVAKMSPLSSAQLTKSQLPEMRDYMANKAGSKCCTQSGEEHEYKGQPRYSADEYLFNRAYDMICGSLKESFVYDKNVQGHPTIVSS